MATCLIALGSNLGNRAATLASAVRGIANSGMMRVLAVSRWYETAAIGGPPDQPAYLNGAVRIETALDPRAVLRVLNQIELELGRQRRQRWAARSVDLDLLLCGDLTIQEPDLTLPHPRMAFRRFVLDPAVEIAGELVDPITRLTLEELRERLCQRPRYIALAGIHSEEKTELARRVAGELSGRFAEQNRFPTANGSASRFLASAIEFLRERAAIISAGGESGQWVVSDFWFPELLAWSAESLPTEMVTDFRRQWDEVNREILQPRIVACCTAAGTARMANSDSCRLAEAIEGMVRQPEWGPILRLEGLELENAGAEIVAAAEASESSGLPVGNQSQPIHE